MVVSWLVFVKLFEVPYLSELSGKRLGDLTMHTISDILGGFSSR